MIENRGNWAGNYTYSAVRLYRPATVGEVQELVARAAKVKALGTRHSFNDIADSPGDLISLERLNRVVALDVARRTVTIEGGVRYGALAPFLNAEGFALHNMASLPHISVAGACATGTHGSGERNATLAAAIAALEIVRADGTLVTLSREQEGEQLRGAAISLGALGVITRLTLDLVQAYEMRQVVYEGLPFQQVDEHLDEILARAYSVSLFTDWRGATFNQVWLKYQATEQEAVETPPAFFGGRLAAGPRHPIAALSPENCTAQLGAPGPWYERLPHFRLDYTPSSGEELQSEYLVPRRHARAALRAVDDLRAEIAPLLQISEVRAVAADDLWMSACYGQPCLAIHFTWKKEWLAVARLLPRIEAALAPFEARPHWGKLFALPPDRLRALYPRLPDFRALAAAFDPAGKFHNAFLERYLFGA